MPKYYRKKEQFRVVTLEEIKQYVTNSPDLQTQLVIALVWLTGARVAEILKLTKEDFILEEDNLTVVNNALKKGKTGYPTFSFSDPYILNLIVPYVKGLSAGSKLFVRSKRRYQQILLDLNKAIFGYEEKNYITFHYLRHSRITYLTRELQASPEEIKSWTGHNSNAFEEYFRSRKVERFRGKIR